MIRFNENNEIISSDHPRAVLVAASKGQESPELLEWRTGELSGLAEAAGAEVIGVLTQNVESINAATYIGSGKLEELSDMCSNMDAELVIFDGELSGMQLRNIENACGVKVIDRTILILDIFADRASSAEGKLQVEMAQLQYRMPRLLGFGRSLSRQGGGIGTRGPGEKKLETDRRHIQKRIDDIRRELKEVARDRGVRRAKRESSELPVAALVGYTNAGKSSIMNRFLSEGEREDKRVFEKDMLFATLDTSHRLVQLDEKHSFILIDTVGFVSDLPHTLVEAFKGTLEELSYADLLIDVVDASFAEHDRQIAVTEGVIKQLGAEGKPRINVFNKTDLVPGFEAVGYGSDSVCVSAKTGEGFDELRTVIKEKLFSDHRTVDLLIPYEKGDIVSLVCGKAKPESIKYTEEGTLIRVGLGSADRSRLKEYIV